MVENLLKIKKVSKEWGQMRRGLDQKELKELEHKIHNIYSSNKTGVFSKEEMENLRMEERKRNLLLL